MSSLVRNRVLQHILFWAFSFYILLRVFADSGEYPIVDIIYTALFHLTLWVVVYPNLLILIPRYLQKEKYVSYFFSLTLITLGGVLFNILFFDKLVDYVFPGYYFISYYEFIDILQFFVAYVIITSLIKLSRSWFLVLEKEKEVARLAEEKKISELKALKSQVNPHFLFNNLNNIYGQALQNDKSAPEMILRLSNVLRYMIYEAEKERTSLNDEINYIGDYLELEKQRNEHLDISLDIIGEPRTKNIAPLLFIPFIENAFKYCSKKEGSYVHISFEISESSINFQIENSVDKVRESRGGFGISNVRQRLELQYPGNFDLDIRKESDKFSVRLRISNGS